MTMQVKTMNHCDPDAELAISRLDQHGITLDRLVVIEWGGRILGEGSAEIA
jgi:hypothetical protein